MKCIACGGDHLTELVTIPQVPVFCNQLCHTKQDALDAAVASMRMVYCEDCQHLFNADFDPAKLEYSPEYENSLHFSGRFQQFADELAARLRASYQLPGKTVLEVGCGSGDFLKSLCVDASTKGFGFDASYPGDDLAKPPPNVTIAAEFFGEKHRHIQPDLFCNRHVLEHISAPQPWLADLRTHLPAGVSLYLEVPDALYTLRDGGIWDLIYEHVSYFSPRSVSQILTSAGFQVQSLEQTFEGQFISVFGNSSDAAKPFTGELANAAEHVEPFRKGYEQKVSEWQSRLNELTAARKKTVIWGAGSKGNTFLNVIASPGEIEFAVDLNPRKQGKFVAGTGQEIIAPERLKDYRPDVVVVMNPAYLEEIAKMGGDLGLSAEYIAA